MPASKKNAAVLCAGTKKRRRGEMSELADAAAAREDERAAARIGIGKGLLLPRRMTGLDPHARPRLL